jgi:neutral ceramidase
MIAHFAMVTTDSDDDPRRRHSREEIYADRIAKIQKAPKEIHIQLQAFRIGDLGIAAIPFETFSETGLELKDRSPFGKTFTIELANGFYGYLPTPEQHRLGGYETWLGSNYVEKEATTKIVATLLDLFQSLQQLP